MELEQGDLVLCTVDRIAGTTVFVKIPYPKGDLEGTIVMSEIAPGRIRNLREYVVPKKKIVCKVLRISGNNIQLSLRRVTQKEKKEVLEQAKLEKSYERVLQSILGESYQKAVDEIKKENSLYNFLENSKENPDELEKIVGRENAEKIFEIIKKEKEKTTSIKKEITLTTPNSNGLERIKEILKKAQDIEVKYASSGKYSLKKTSNDIKKAKQDLNTFVSEVEKFAKENNLNFAIQEK